VIPAHPYRIVQWTTCNIGKSAVAAITANPGLELVGGYAHSPDKVGSDAGELAGIPAVGVTQKVGLAIRRQTDEVFHGE
jgi:2,4-diaminopentanoate dehydrogenase